MLKLTLDNPVITKEFRSRMRGSRAYWMLFGYLSLLSGTLFVAYLLWWQSQRALLMYGGGGTAAYEIGRTFFQVVFCTQAILIALITPALTAGAISLEREQRTFELLQTTTLPPRQIVLGKLAASVSFIVLLLTASLPLVSLCFLLGGVSPGEVFWAYLLLVCDAFLFGAIGLAWSAHAATTSAATALSYGTLVLFFLFTFPLSIPRMFTGSPGGSGGALGAVNPIWGVFAAVSPERYFGVTLPAWLPALLLNGMLGVTLLLACINALDDFPTRRAAPLRFSTLALFFLILFFGDGFFVGRVGVTPALNAALLSLGALLAFVPLIATGRENKEKEVENEEKNGNFLTRGRLRDGLAYALTLGLIAAAMLTLTTLGRTGIERVIQADALLVAVAFGLAGLGRGFSTLTESRWTALVLLMVTGVALIALPYFSLAALEGTDAMRAARSPLVISLYACPIPGIAESIEGVTQMHRYFPATAGLPGGGAGTGIVTTLLYVIFGVLGLKLAAKKPTPKKSTLKNA